ncbi:MAG: hypothetical protein IKW28_04895, partial [Lachnospiraceae bacterium]|nr:hypothetical protein [Lachnospiraceae bacterium]
KAGKTQKFSPVVTSNGKKLAMNKDFSLSQNSIDITSPKEEIHTITGKGNYTGVRTIKVIVGTAKQDIALSKVKVTLKNTAKPKVEWKSGGYTFTNEEIAVIYNKEKLVLGRDYEILDYENNKKVGTATLILQGMGSNRPAQEGTETASKYNFHGQKRITFQITGTNMSTVQVKIPDAEKKNGYTYSGEAIELLKDENVKVTLADGNTPVSEESYTVSYSKNENKGTATATLTGNPEKGFTGTKKVTYKIAAQKLTKEDISFASGEAKTVIMKGGAKPQLAVVVKGRTLVEGTDFTVTYGNNKKVTTDARKATAKIKGKGNYAGEATVEFAIEGKAVNSEGVTLVAKDLVLKNGKFEQKSFKVYDADGKALKAGTDYVKTAVYTKTAEDGSEVAVSNPQPGDVITITVTGAGDYKGSGETPATISTTYRLMSKEQDISKATIKIADQFYTGGKVTITATEDVFTTAVIKSTSTSLFVEGVPSFEILEDTYQKNEKKGTAKVTIRGTGNLAGEKVVTFKIVEKDIEKESNWWNNLLKVLF